MFEEHMVTEFAPSRFISLDDELLDIGVLSREERGIEEFMVTEFAPITGVFEDDFSVADETLGGRAITGSLLEETVIEDVEVPDAFPRAPWDVMADDMMEAAPFTYSGYDTGYSY